MSDKGRSAALIRAVKQLVVLKGLGYSGAHISGPGINYREVEWIIEKSDELAPSWTTFVREFNFPMKDGFYLYKKDIQTGLNTDELSRSRHQIRKSVAYACMRFLHRSLFLPDSGLYSQMCDFFSKVEGSRFERMITELEYSLKFLTSRCRRCGDCTLAEVGFLCPQSQCPKFLFNGQCGGSRDGWCEVFPGERLCIYVRAYDRYRGFGEERSLRNGYIKPRDWALDQTSSWLNYFLGRDHYGKSCRSSDV
jgi:methylenetetrahydrofolate reductase (NADPH)